MGGISVTINVPLAQSVTHPSVSHPQVTSPTPNSKLWASFCFSLPQTPHLDYPLLLYTYLTSIYPITYTLLVVLFSVLPEIRKGLLRFNSFSSVPFPILFVLLPLLLYTAFEPAARQPPSSRIPPPFSLPAFDVLGCTCVDFWPSTLFHSVPTPCTMNKLANMRHWSDRINPNFGGMGRPNMPMNPLNPHHKNTAQPGPPLSSPHAADATLHSSFIVPFASDLAGPNTEDILHATTDAVLRWTHPADAPDDIGVHELPAHVEGLNTLNKLCRDLTAGPLPIEAYVLATSPDNGKSQQIITVCLSGSPDLVHKSREAIFNDTPISLVSLDPRSFAPLEPKLDSF